MQIKEKIERIGTPLKDWDIRINYGIKTGFNDAFIIDRAKRKELIEQDPKSAEIIRPILRGRDIKRYSYDFADLWLINVHNGVKEKGISKINIEDYPAIKKHLDQFYPQLKKRADKGDTPYNLRNCAYMEDFFRPKIIWKIIGDQLAFSIDYNKYMLNNACYILTGNHLNYLLAFLNSKIIKWYSLLTNMNKTGVGDMQVGAQNVNIYPVPLPLKKYEKHLNDLICELIELDKMDLNKLRMLEEQLNQLIFDIYQLTSEEIGFIEAQ